VTDTLKWVDEAGVILGTADREQFRMVYSPQAYWPTQLRSLLADATPEQLRAEGADVLPRLVQAAGGNLVAVPAPGEVFRLSTSEDLVLADAMSHIGVGADDEPASCIR
jgi:2-C-methyl-D-erythritol 4-phosphate cytidylyltransferase